MSPLHISFLQCLVFIIFGQLIRLLKLKTPEQKKTVSFITKIVIQVTLPCLLVRSMSQLRTFPLDGVLLMSMYVAYNIIAAVVGVIVYHKRPVEVGAGLTASVLGMNVGVFFYPIMEQIAGAPGVARLAMYDTANELFVFLVYPRIFDWARRRYKRKLDAAAAAAKEDENKHAPRPSEERMLPRSSEDSHGDVEMEPVTVLDPNPLRPFRHTSCNLRRPLQHLLCLLPRQLLRILHSYCGRLHLHWRLQLQPQHQHCLRHPNFCNHGIRWSACPAYHQASLPHGM